MADTFKQSVNKDNFRKYKETVPENKDMNAAAVLFFLLVSNTLAKIEIET